jgi:hypothetical protein
MDLLYSQLMPGTIGKEGKIRYYIPVPASIASSSKFFLYLFFDNFPKINSHFKFYQK